MVKKSKNEPIINNKHEALREKVQSTVDKGKRISMGEFQKNWNLKNKEKITEMVKLDHTILVRFNNVTIHVFTDKLYL